LGWEPVKDDSKWIETVTEELDAALGAMARK
jgi:hypothetical protein